MPGSPACALSGLYLHVPAIATSADLTAHYRAYIRTINQRLWSSLATYLSPRVVYNGRKLSVDALHNFLAPTGAAVSADLVVVDIGKRMVAARVEIELPPPTPNGSPLSYPTLSPDYDSPASTPAIINGSGNGSGSGSGSGSGGGSGSGSGSGRGSGSGSGSGSGRGSGSGSVEGYADGPPGTAIRRSPMSRRGSNSSAPETIREHVFYHFDDSWRIDEVWSVTERPIDGVPAPRRNKSAPRLSSAQRMSPDQRVMM